MLAAKVAGILSAQLLLVAVFFCAMNIVKTENGFLIIKVLLIIMSALLMTIGAVISVRYRNTYNYLPDDIGLRQSEDIIKYAYDIAIPALDYNMLISGIIGAAGVLTALIIVSIMPEDSGMWISRSVFCLFLAAAVFVLVPSLWRKQTYEQMRSRHIGRNAVKNDKKLMIQGVLLSFLVPGSTCIYLLWRYFGRGHNETAWIVFCLSGIIYGAVDMLVIGNE